MPLPGCEGILGVGDVPPEWVVLYREDILEQSTHLYDVDIGRYLDANANGWRLVATLRSAGNHWSVDLARARGGALVVTTVADGNCGAYAAHAVINRAHILANTGLALNYAGGDPAVVRNAVQALLTDAAIRARILGEVHRAPNVFEAGFGPALIAAVQKLDPGYKTNAVDVGAALMDWTPDTAPRTVNGPFGLQFDARHNQGAPYLSGGPSPSQMVANPKKKESYAAWVRVIKACDVAEKDLARYLRMEDMDELSPLALLLKTQEQRLAVSMLWATVNLAEEWRKAGAKKVFRALMRAVEKGQTDLGTAVLNGFRFKKSADQGRTQIGLVQDILAGDGPPSKASVDDANRRPRRGEPKLSEEQKRKRGAIRRKADDVQIKWAGTIVANISDGESDLSSDDEDEENRRLTSKKRKFSKKHEEDEQ